MDRAGVETLLQSVRRGETAVADAVARLAAVLPAADGAAIPPGHGTVARIDHHRALRCGHPEVVLGDGKREDDLVRIAREILGRSPSLLVTRVGPAQARALLDAIPGAVHHERARAVTARPVAARTDPEAAGRSGVTVLCAGTADVPVAEEARVTAEAMGEAPRAIYDVGVAGLHRLLAHGEVLRASRVLVVVAGMDGALPSVVGGLVACPVIAVPSSVGYGTGVGGIAPLLTMLNACAPNVCVVNVDNGFGAGYLAALVNAAR